MRIVHRTKKTVFHNPPPIPRLSLSYVSIAVKRGVLKSSSRWPGVKEESSSGLDFILDCTLLCQVLVDEQGVKTALFY